MPTNPKSKIENPKSEYTVLARRYRPQQFTDLVGQEPLARALVNALKTGRVAHAYLFTGARGVGKTSTARILAKALNCVSGPTPTPCDACDSCKAIAVGEDIDVLEIDAASNRGIDHIREIRGNVQFRPSRSRFKIYIIDEVHMLTRESFNALLKTLEEPPPHVKFIFATTEVEKVPITILSRCQRFDFAGISPTNIVVRLRDIVQREGMEADDDALALVARRAAGSMRDAQSLLDQLLAFGGERLTVAQVHQLLGTAQDDRVADLAAAVLQHDVKKALDLLRQAADEGLQLGELLEQLIGYWRDLMIVNCAGTEGQDLNVPPSHRESLVQQGAALKLDTILAGLDILSAVKARMRGSSHGRVLLEMALVRLGRLDHLVSLAQLAQWLEQGPAPRAQGDRTGQPASAQRLSAAVQPPEAVKKKPEAIAEAASPLTQPSPPTAGGEGWVRGPMALSAASLPRVWKEVLTQLGGLTAADLQKAGVPAIAGPNTLALRFPAQYNSERRYFEEPARLKRIEEVVRKVTGQAYQLRVESVSGDSNGLAEAPAADDAADSSSRHRGHAAAVENEPLIQRAIEVLGARFVRERTDEGFGAVPTAPPERAGPTGEEDG